MFHPRPGRGTHVDRHQAPWRSRSSKIIMIRLRCLPGRCVLQSRQTIWSNFLYFSKLGKLTRKTFPPARMSLVDSNTFYATFGIFLEYKSVRIKVTRTNEGLQIHDQICHRSEEKLYSTVFLKNPYYLFGH